MNKKDSDNFYIKKIYADRVDNDGNLFICYLAKIKWNLININYSFKLHIDTKLDDFREVSSFKNFQMPNVNNGIFEFESKNINLNFKYKNISPTNISEKLFENNDNETVNWNCFQAISETEIISDNKLYKGLGYAEILEMNVKPWKLPVNVLKWGRFVSKEHSLVWIVWEGSHPISKFWLDGKLIEVDNINENGIKFQDKNIELKFIDTFNIRDGKVVNLLPKASKLLNSIGNKIINLHETKYLSKSILTFNSQEFEGWSIYEVVHWNQTKKI